MEYFAFIIVILIVATGYIAIIKKKPPNCLDNSWTVINNEKLCFRLTAYTVSL